MLIRLIYKIRDMGVSQGNYDFRVREELVGCPYFHYKLEAA
jgi:hypothetical protein